MNLEDSKIIQWFKERPLAVVIIMIAAYTTFFSYFTIIKHYAYQTYAYDLGIFMQYLWTTLNGHGILYAPVLESSCFAWHFQPILFLLLPIYAVLPYAETLLVLQSAALALGALPIYWMARDELGTKFGVIFAFLYLIYPALHGINSYDFHPVALTVPLLLFCFYAFKKKQYKRGMLFAILAMMCKENVALIIIFLGFYWLWMERKGQIGKLSLSNSLPRKREVIYPLCLSLLGAIWFVLAMNVIIPSFSITSEYPYFSNLGYGYSLRNLFVATDTKMLYLLLLFGPLLATPLLNPVTLISLPILAQNLLSKKVHLYLIGYQYPSLLIPWIFVGAIYGVKWLSSVKGKGIEAIRNRFLWILLPTAVFITLWASPSPISFSYEMPQITAHQQIIQEAIDLIPEDASIYTQSDILPHIAHRLYAYADLLDDDLDFFRFGDGNYDYILADITTDQSILKYGSDESMERLSQDYGIYAKGNGVYLFKRDYNEDAMLLGQ